MAVDVGDVFEVTARGEFGGVEDIVNVYQYQFTSGTNETDAIAISNLLDIIEVIYTLVRTMQNLANLYRDIRVKNVTKGVVYGTFGWPALTGGSVNVGNAVPGIAGLINLSTDIPRVILKKYFGGLDTSMLEGDGTLTSTATSILVSVGVELLDPQTVGSNTYVYGYLSPKTSNFEIPGGAVVTDIPAYQRRRKQGRGV